MATDYENYDEYETTAPVKENPKGKKRTGAKIVGGTICALALAGGLLYGGIKCANYIGDVRETNRAESIVSINMNQDKLVELPVNVKLNQAYDQDFCEGEKLISQLEAGQVQYCKIGDEYYTKSGETIAILTIEYEVVEEAEPTLVEINGSKMYYAPVGYILEGNKCIKKTYGEVTKVVPASANEDYSNISLAGVDNFEITNVEVVQAKPFKELEGKTLVCDVPDGATLNEDGCCDAVLRLIPRR